MSAALRRRLKVAGTALAKAGRVRLPSGPAAGWSEADAAAAGVLLTTCGRALWSRLDDEDVEALAARWKDGEQD